MTDQEIALAVSAARAALNSRYYVWDSIPANQVRDLARALVQVADERTVLAPPARARTFARHNHTCDCPQCLGDRRTGGSGY